jgi:hypothetical protein
MTRLVSQQASARSQSNQAVLYQAVRGALFKKSTDLT